MRPAAGHGDLVTLYLLLLSVALLAGIGQLWRCLFAARDLSPRGGFPLVLVGWHLVFFDVLVRMVDVLGLGS